VARRPHPAPEWPPPLAIVAGALAATGVLPGILFALGVVVSLGYGLVLLGSPYLATAFVVLPVLLGYGAVQLMSRRSRVPLLVGGLPVTAWIAWRLQDAAQGTGELPAEVFLLLGPGLAPLVALAPSVERWLRAAPGGTGPDRDDSGGWPARRRRRSRAGGPTTGRRSSSP
jgi:hypothetical protein